MGASCGSGGARAAGRGTGRTTRRLTLPRKAGSGTRASTAAGRASSSTTGRTGTGNPGRLFRLRGGVIEYFIVPRWGRPSRN